MEYFPYGDLARYLKSPIAEHDIKQITIDLLEGLKIIHAEGFTHRDLKPQVCLSLLYHFFPAMYEVIQSDPLLTKSRIS